MTFEGTHFEGSEGRNMVKMRVLFCLLRRALFFFEKNEYKLDDEDELYDTMYVDDDDDVVDFDVDVDVDVDVDDDDDDDDDVDDAVDDHVMGMPSKGKKALL